MKNLIQICTIVTLATFLITGCGKDTPAEEPIIMLFESTPLAIANKENIGTEYIRMSSQYAYFVQRSDDSHYTIFTHSIAAPKEESRKLMTINCNYLIDFELMPDASRDVLYTLYIRESNLFAASYDSDGQLQKEIQIQKPESNKLFSLYGIVCQSDGEKILVYNNEAYYQLKDNGTLIRCPFDKSVAFLNDMSADAEGNLYISYDDNRHASHIGILSRLDGTLLSDIATNELYSFYRHGDKLYTRDARSIYRLTVDGLQAEFQLSDIRKNGRKLRDFLMINGEWFAVCCPPDSELLSVSLIHFFAVTGEYDVQNSTLSPIEPPEILTVYSTEPYINFKYLIEDYNDEEGDYFVVIQMGTKESMPRDLLAPDAPDLLANCFTFHIESYVRNGYLEEIGSILDEQLTEDIYPIALPYCTVDGKLYAVPESIGFQALCCSQYDAALGEGWTVDELLDWMEANKEIESYFTKEDIFYQILLGNLDEYVDFQRKEAYFEESSFRNMVERFRHLNCEVIPVEMGQLPTGTYAYLNMVNSVAGIGEQELISNGKVAFVGYPNAKREPRGAIAAMPNLSLLTSCDCREGAADFIRYLYQHKKDKFLYHYNIENDFRPNGSLQPLKSLNELEFAGCLGKHSMANNIQMSEYTDMSKNTDVIDYLCTKEHIEIYDQYVEHVLPYTNQYDAMINLIIEESAPYFENQKKIEEVCAIIQSRATVLLNE